MFLSSILQEGYGSVRSEMLNMLLSSPLGPLELGNRQKIVDYVRNLSLENFKHCSNDTVLITLPVNDKSAFSLINRPIYSLILPTFTITLIQSSMRQPVPN